MLRMTIIQKGEPMDDLISRQAALYITPKAKADRDYRTNNLDDAYEDGFDDALNAIAEIPSAERHGRWIKKYRGNYLCSVCGAWYRTTDDYGNIVDGEMTANYCESCGAKMDEVETNETCTSRRSE